jgi:hypothetical protein
MQPLEPIIISNELFQELDAELLTLLRSLGDHQQRGEACQGAGYFRAAS